MTRERMGRALEKGAFSDGDTDAPVPGYSSYVLGVLVGAYVLNYIDRLIVSILLDPIKKDLGVSDAAMGLLTGFAFSVFYALLIIPIARLADTRSRRNLLAAGIAFWSLMTSLCGLAHGYLQLLLARIGVGIGEAAGVAPSHSLISDYFPPHRRARAFGIYSAAIYLGIMCGLILGGLLTEMFSWRVAFVVVGLPGLFLALLVKTTVREPQRGNLDTLPVQEAREFGEVLRFIRHQRAYVCLVVGISLVAFQSNGFNVWVPALLGRVHAIRIGEIGITLGILKGVCGVLGTLSGGWLADHLGERDVKWHLLLPAGSNLLGGLLLAIFALWKSYAGALAIYAVATIVLATTFGPVFALAQNLVHVRMRALAAAIVLGTTTLLGGGGPLWVGVMNDFWASQFGLLAIRYSLTMTALSNLIAAFFFWQGARYLTSDLTNLR